MIVYDFAQYSRDWWEKRLGMPTASRFNQIVTEKTLKYSSASRTFIADLMMERRTGKPADYKEGDDEDLHGFDAGGTPWTRRGSDVEAEARIWYQMHSGEKIEEVGFITDDEGNFGCSPDGIQRGRSKGLEIKCRSAKFHMRMLLGEEIAGPAQVQGSMWVTGLDSWDVLAYCPGQPSKVETHYRDPAFMAAFDKFGRMFLDDLEEATERLGRIREDVVEGTNIEEAYARALQKKPTRPNPLEGEPLVLFASKIVRAEGLGLLGAADIAPILNDIWNEDWESVQGMMDYTDRLLEDAAPSTV